MDGGEEGITVPVNSAKYSFTTFCLMAAKSTIKHKLSSVFASWEMLQKIKATWEITC